jgi:glutathione S-transferase
MSVRIHGRSSSHFTRVTRVFAHEFGVSYTFHPIRDLLSQTDGDYAGNPALKMPVLETPEGAWFGALSICREFARRASTPRRVIWPEQLSDRMASNAQELVLQGMASEVAWIMRKLAEPEAADAYFAKTRASLLNSLAWLETHLPDALRSLQREEALSFLEVTSYCFLAHLDFRKVVDTSAYPRLRQLGEGFAQRPSARETEYGFDPA